jgi:uncharacterized membrane protein
MVGVAFIVIVIGTCPGMIFNKSMVFSGNLITWILSTILGIGTIKIALKIHDKKSAGMEDFLSLKLNQFLDYLITSFLTCLIVLGGLILLIVPGIIFALKYQFATYLIIDKKMRPIDAIKESGRITKEHLGSLFCLWLVSILIVIAGCIAVGVGLLLAFPVILLAQTYVYKKLVK